MHMRNIVERANLSQPIHYFLCISMQNIIHDRRIVVGEVR